MMRPAVDSSSIPLFKAMADKMRQLTAKQQVVAQNIANADTPGYRARELVERDFSDVLAKVEGGAGAPRVAKPHIEASSTLAALGSRAAKHLDSEVQKDVFETKPNGNTVVLEEQLLQLADVQTEYTALTNLYRKQNNLLKVALGRGN